MSGPGEAGPPPHPEDQRQAVDDAGSTAGAHRDSGLDLAKQIARSTAGTAGTRGRRQRSKQGGGVQRRGRDPDTRPGWAREDSRSSAHPDERDPQTLDVSLGRLVESQGWRPELRVHGVISRWEELVGAQVAQHVSTQKFTPGDPETGEGGILTVKADSTAWATEMRLLTGALLTKINAKLGPGTVGKIEVQGPTAPKWTKGPRSVRGRGPRDTYG